ncbi:MAG: hypothetical protein OXH99_05025 [Bryobacterales bacterium]|nr:hypothetical protein [Bryobacterales bacterium]
MALREPPALRARLHDYDEGRCRGRLRNLACLTNATISIIRCQPEFRYEPEANRHFAARVQEALDLLLVPPWD